MHGCTLADVKLGSAKVLICITYPMIIWIKILILKINTATNRWPGKYYKPYWKIGK